MKKTLLLLAFVTGGCLMAAEMPDLAACGYAQPPIHCITRTTPAGLDLAGRTAQLELEWTLLPGKPVADWMTDSQAARETGGTLPDRLTVATLEVVYQDGVTVQTNIRYNESVGAVVRDWWNPADGFIAPLAFAQVVWTRPLDEDGLRHAAVYRMEWPNPRPDALIESAFIRAAPALGEGSLFVFAARLGGPEERSGNTFFVAPGGDDAREGSFAQPWATLHKAASAMQAGDTVYVRGGEYRLKERILFEEIASTGVWTRVIGYPGETAVLNCMDVLWDRSPDRVKKGWETFPHDVGMLLVHHCSRFQVKNLRLINSRSRGLMAEYGDHIEFLYNRVERTYGPAIRMGKAEGAGYRAIGNVLFRGCCRTMCSAEDDTLGDVKELTGYPKPPCEQMDIGSMTGFEIAYNEIGWGDKEALMLDGSVRDGRVHHNYVHNARNLPWSHGIMPNGYGIQRNIEIDHNLAHHVGTGLAIGSEGGGSAEHIRIHHNIAWDCFWNPVSVAGAWKDRDASLRRISVHHNTGWRNGHDDSVKGPAGGIAVFFPRKTGSFFNGRRVDLNNSSLSDVLIMDNVILEPRDYALALVNDGDHADAGIRFEDNLTDLAGDSRLISGKTHLNWRAFRVRGLRVTEGPVLRDPENYDFRLRPGMTAGGDGDSPGAFGSGAKWVDP